MQDRELSYVQMSRTRGETRIYTERAEAGDTIAGLAKDMHKSRQKGLAQDVSRYAADTYQEHERGEHDRQVLPEQRLYQQRTR